MQPRVLQADHPGNGEHPTPVPWTVRDAVGVLLSWLGFQLVMGLAVVMLRLRVEAPFTAAALVAVIPLALLVLTVAWVKAGGPGRLRPLLGERLSGWSTEVFLGACYGIAGTVLATFVIGGGLQLLLRYVGVEIPPTQEQLRDLATGPAAPIAVIAIVVLAPIGEELFFRGMLFQALRERYRFWPAALASGIVFGAIHGEPLVAVITAVLGVYLAWLFQHRGTLLTPIIAHAIFNGLGVVLIRLQLG